MKERAWQTLLLSALLGAAIWAATPWLTSSREPWDAGNFFYYTALLIAGLIAGWLRPKPLWAHYLGAIIGQLAYALIFLRVGALVIIGAVLLLYYCFYYLAGAWLGGYLRHKSMK